MKSSRALPGLPPPLARAISKLGRDLSAARRRRRISMQLLAERAFVSRGTIVRLERGDPGVSLGILASVLFVLGLSHRIGELAAPATDEVGLALDEERLPKRAVARRGASPARRR
jgi:transcriptional regulator with XRE-family HTH domain